MTQAIKPAMTRRALMGAAALSLVGSRVTFAQTPLPVVATFSILADITRTIGGARVAVTSLVGPDGDAHVYQPTPADARALSGAKVVVVNGLGFEGWITRLVRSSGTKAEVITATRGITPLKAKEEHDHGHSHGTSDPHVWQDVGRMGTYVANIRDALIAADPEGRSLFEANASTYTALLTALDAEIKATIARVPPERRRVLLSHDAFQYFEKAYGLTVIAPRGVSTEAEPSARDVARIIRQLREQRITAVFLENVTDPRLASRIAQEAGVAVGGKLYSDALSGPNGPASTYLLLMRHNLAQFASALLPTG